MNPFYETLSVAGALALTLVGTIVVLTLFYRVLSWTTENSTKAENLSVHGVIKRDTLVTVVMNAQEVYEQVYFRGYLNSSSSKGNVPWEMNEMVILEDESKQKILIRAKDIKKIIIPSEES